MPPPIVVSKIQLFNFFGNISFAWYLTHQQIGYQIINIGLSLSIDYYIVTLFAIVITIAIAYMLTIFEKLMNRYIKSKIFHLKW